MIVNQKNIENFRKNGIFIAKGVAVVDFKDRIIDDLLSIIKSTIKYSNTDNKTKLLYDDFFKYSEDLQKSEQLSKCIDFVIENENDHEYSSALYEIFYNSPVVISSINNKFINDTLVSLGVKHPLASDLPLVRIDRANYRVFDTPWHQDYWQSYLSHNAIVAWFSLTHLFPSIGLLEVIPRSHKEGCLNFKKFEKGASPFTLADNISTKSPMSIKLKYDEILFFNSYLIHRSGLNNSKTTRITMQMRYNDLTTLKKQVSPYVIKYSDCVESFHKSQLNLCKKPEV
jgi:hypothetical protein